MSRGLWIGLAVAVLCLGGCSDDDKKKTPIDPGAPFPYGMPAVQSMQVDLADLAASTDLSKEPQGLCHGAATLVAAWVTLNVQARLLFPEIALAACLGQPSVFLGEATWRWTATGGQGGNAWTAELTASVASLTMINWEMRISGTSRGLDRFLWFEGGCDPVARSGHWNYYNPESPQTSKRLIECDWSLPADEELDRTLGFENVDAASADIGDQLNYALADSVASIVYVDASAQAITEARWDLRDGTGYAVDAEGVRCCWGARPLYADVECP